MGSAYPIGLSHLWLVTPEKDKPKTSNNPKGVTMIDPQVQQLLDAKDRIMAAQQEQITLLQELAEQRRLVHLHQTRELAEWRAYGVARKHRWGFFWWLLLQDVWPFSIWYHRFD
jgi:hypothetical protein